MSLLPVVPAYEGDFALTITGNNVVLSTALSNAGWTEDTNVVVRCGGTIGSTSTANPAILCDVDTEYTVRLIVPLGVYVSGKGGDGGDGQEGGAGFPGEDGGTAIEVTQPIIIQNSGVIQGGGGGGGGGGSLYGGGGGAGILAGQGGTGDLTSGTNGTGLSGGSGGGGTAGDGGDPGEDGLPTGTLNAGGSGGLSIDGYSLVTYSGSGTLTGDTG